MSKNEDKLEKIFYGFLKFRYYYTIVLSVMSLILYYFKIDSILFITAILLVFDFVISFFKGEFGLSLILYLICIFIAYKFIVNNLLDCILIGISFGNILMIIINKLVWKFISFMVSKFN